MLTLAFTGFPDGILNVKEQLELLNIGSEAPGSKWPKTTIGYKSRAMSLEELCRIKDICTDFNSIVFNLSILVDKLHFTMFTRRDLSKLLVCEVLDLGVPALNEFKQESIDRVKNVLSEFTYGNLATYIDKVNSPGHGPEHYSEACIDSTIVHFIESDYLKQLIIKFQNAVDKQLPGLYSWAPQDSLHVTIRGINSG